MKLEQAARQASYVLYRFHTEFTPDEVSIYNNLREALAEQAELMEENISHHKSEQEPVAWRDDFERCRVQHVESFCHSHKVFQMMQKYAAPVRTKDLTDKQIEKVWNKNGGYMGMPIDFARAVIAADREKNK